MTDLLARTRPTRHAVTGEWTPDSALLLDTLRSIPTPRRHPRRALIGAAAAGVAGVLAVPALVPGWFLPAAGAAELEPVAAAAGARPSLTWGDRQFLHTRTKTSQHDRDVNSDQVIDDWRTPDGWTWSRRGKAGEPPTKFYIFGPGWGWMRPGYAATMPTEPHLLDAFLRARVSGSASQDEAVFVAIGDMLRQEAAPADLRGAAIRVLGLNPHVRVARETFANRTAVRASFVDESVRPGVAQSLVLEAATGYLLAEESSWPEGTYRTEITRREVVDALPASVVTVLGERKTTRAIEDGKEYSTKGDLESPDPSPHPSETYTPNPTASSTR